MSTDAVFDFEKSARPRRNRRRKKKHKKAVGPDAESGGSKVKAAEIGESSQGEKKSLWKQRKRKKRSKQVCLRPYDPPKAPENFTQFIIDDHKNCSLFINFEQSSVDDEDLDSQEADKDFWLQDSKDFESLYQSAREENFTEYSREDLIAMIQECELREKELKKELALKCPETILQHYQQRLLFLQEQNRLLRRGTSRETDSSTSGSSSSGGDVDTSVETKEETPTTSSHSDSEKENQHTSTAVEKLNKVETSDKIPPPLTEQSQTPLTE